MTFSRPIEFQRERAGQKRLLVDFECRLLDPSAQSFKFDCKHAANLLSTVFKKRGALQYYLELLEDVRFVTTVVVDVTAGEFVSVCLSSAVQLNHGMAIVVHSLANHWHYRRHNIGKTHVQWLNDSLVVQPRPATLCVLAAFEAYDFWKTFVQHTRHSVNLAYALYNFDREAYALYANIIEMHC